MSTWRWATKFPLPKSLTSPQFFEHCSGRKAIRNVPGRGLEPAESHAGPQAKVTVRLADVVATPRQQFLQLPTFGPRENPLMPGPRLDKGVATAQPIGQIANRERIGFRGVVFHDRAEVRQH